jgi:hypothetical protein
MRLSDPNPTCPLIRPTSRVASGTDNNTRALRSADTPNGFHACGPEAIDPRTADLQAVALKTATYKGMTQLLAATSTIQNI